MSEGGRTQVKTPTRPADRRPSITTTVTRRPTTGLAFAAPHTLGLAIFTIIPIAITIALSLGRWSVGKPYQSVGLENYQRLLDDPLFFAALRNTAVFVIAYVPLNLIVSLGLAAWLTPKIRHRHIFRVLFFIPSVTPVVANVIVWRMVYVKSGLIDATLQATTGHEAPNFLASATWAMPAIILMTIWQNFGYNMIIFSAALDAVPESTIEAANLDGAGPWRTFWHVKLPAITPSLFFAIVMTMIGSFQIFTQPFILTRGGPGSSTLTIMQYIYESGFQYQQIGLAAAAGWILFVIIVGVTAAQFGLQRKWVHYG